MRYLDPKNDLVFKKIFGQFPNITMSFLNSLLPLEVGQEIRELEYLPIELVPELPGIIKNSIVDVRCRDNRGRQFIVEMQMLWTNSFKNRVLFNASKAYVRQLEKNEEYTMLQPVFALSIVNQKFEPNTDQWYHHYKMVHIQDIEKCIDGLQLVFIELPKFEPKSFSEKKLILLWLRFLQELENDKDMYDDALLEQLMSVPEIAQALELSKESAYSKEELEAYDKYWDMIRVEKALLAGAMHEGREKGIEEGRAMGIEMGIQRGIEKGIEKAKVELVLNAYQNDLNIQLIAKIANMTEEMVTKILDRLKSNDKKQ